MSDARQPVLTLKQLRKSYNVGKPNQTEVLHGIDLEIDKNDFAALVGPSGSGKSTLLNMLGLLDQPTSGELFLQGQPTRDMDDETRTAARGRKIGFVFQFHHLIPAFSVIENVLMPLMIARGKPGESDRQRALKLLGEVGLETFAKEKPGNLSGGQQQRVAIARALITQPALLLADEPTANLDSTTGAALLDLMRKLNAEHGITFVFSTHDPMVMERARRVIHLRDGRVEREEIRP